MYTLEIKKQKPNNHIQTNNKINLTNDEDEQN